MKDGEQIEKESEVDKNPQAKFKYEQDWMQER